MLRAMTIDAPLALHSEPVRPEWIDYNGHMNVAYYTMVFDHMLDAFMDFVGVGEDYTKRTKRSLFILDSRTLYLREVKANDTLRCTMQLLDFDAKRLHYCSQMEHSREGWAVALFEGLSVHVDLGARRSSPMPDPVLKRLAEIKKAHEVLDKPDPLRRAVGLGLDHRG